MIYIGVDPGKKGAFAVIDGEDVNVYPWDDLRFCIILSALPRIQCIAAVEKVGAMPGQGTVSMFNFGKSAGFIEGALTALGIPYQLIAPATWKKEFSLIGKDKSESIAVCKHHCPGISLLPTDRCRKESDGMAEAVLMAKYAQRKL